MMTIIPSAVSPFDDRLRRAMTLIIPQRNRTAFEHWKIGRLSYDQWSESETRSIFPDVTKTISPTEAPVASKYARTCSR